MKYSLCVPIDTLCRIGEAKTAEIAFDGVKFTWVNGNDTTYPKIIIPINFNPIEYVYDYENSSELALVSRFLTMLAAKVHQRLRIHEHHRYLILESNYGDLLPRFQGEYLVSLDEVPKESANSTMLQMALSLYREALNSNSVFYSFLNFFKIVELSFDSLTRPRKSREIKRFIDQHIEDAIKENPWALRSKIAMKKLPTGDEIYRLYRCSIAHASATEMRNPDAPDDFYQVALCLDVIAAVAVYTINSGRIT